MVVTRAGRLQECALVYKRPHGKTIEDGRLRELQNSLIIHKDKTKEIIVFISDVDTAKLCVQFFSIKITISAVCSFIKVLIYM